jgi:formylglycine-generating enzyme required for sulfatase activity
VQGATWFLAAQYCNWLSEKEDIPKDQWCYETNPQGEVIRLRANYLSLAGYRLPSEAEWEYACRAGTSTIRYHGESEQLLGKYAWFAENSEDHGRPVGRKKPNDLGFFDMLGNAWCWCQETYQPYPKANGAKMITVDDTEDKLELNSADARVLRGGAYDYVARVLRSANRNRDLPTFQFKYVSFRPTRTISAK